ncbi:MFS transporter [Paraglaciecola agarilytica]|uniref:MFS transporter n=1 Tax=Paraglaciecola chathamensis TaxID=368405 RepID=UPI002354FD27|nr:MFS transporter [Paraglaciecola agarilytica]
MKTSTGVQFRPEYTPALAPNIGASIPTFIDWHYIFIFLGIYALSVILLLKTFVFRNEGKVLQQERVSVWKRYKQVMSNHSAMRLMFIGSLTFSVLMLFITHASFIYQQHFGVSPLLFSILFSSNVVLMLLMNIANRKLLNHFAPEVILRWSLGLQTCALLLVLLVTLLYPQLWFFMAAVVLTIGFMGAISPNIQACYMEYFSTNTGTAAALKGAVQFSLAGLISAASTLLPESILSIVLTQALCSVIALILLWTTPNRYKSS